jgi:hypothetical protein
MVHGYVPNPYSQLEPGSRRPAHNSTLRDLPRSPCTRPRPGKGRLNRLSTSLLYGPRFTTRFGFGTPFAHALIGAQYATVKVTPVGPKASDLSLAMAFGVGFDLNLGKRAAIRVVQADYFRSNNTLSPRTNGFRASAGFVWKSGPRR